MGASVLLVREKNTVKSVKVAVFCTLSMRRETPVSGTPAFLEVPQEKQKTTEIANNKLFVVIVVD